MRSALAQPATESAAPATGPMASMLSEAARLIELGGPVVSVLLAISVAGLAIALYKWLQFGAAGSRRFRGLQSAVEDWHRGRRAAAREQLAGMRFPLAEDVAWALDAAETADAELLREELQRRGGRFIGPYERYLPALELIYYLAPVLGLLGTVLGMIEAFRGLETAGGGGDSSVLAGGIWEALLTTAVGLSIAIPFAVIHSLLEARLNRMIEQVNDVLTRVLTGGLQAARAE